MHVYLFVAIGHVLHGKRFRNEIIDDDGDDDDDDDDDDDSSGSSSRMIT